MSDASQGSAVVPGTNTPAAHKTVRYVRAWHGPEWWTFDDVALGEITPAQVAHARQHGGDRVDSALLFDGMVISAPQPQPKAGATRGSNANAGGTHASAASNATAVYIGPSPTMLTRSATNAHATNADAAPGDVSSLASGPAAAMLASAASMTASALSGAFSALQAPSGQYAASIGASLSTADSAAAVVAAASQAALAAVGSMSAHSSQTLPQFTPNTVVPVREDGQQAGQPVANLLAVAPADAAAMVAATDATVNNIFASFKPYNPPQ